MSLFRVSSFTEVEASSPVEAAFLVFKKQREQSVASASYSVASDSEVFEGVTISQTAPMEMLTFRELEVAHLVMQGASNGDIGKELAITPRTVKAHVSHIFEKFHVENRVNLATKMMRMKRIESTEIRQAER